jgi:Lectin C-type domain
MKRQTKKNLMIAAIAASITLSGPAQAGIWDDFVDWVETAAEDTTNWVEGAWEDSVDWTAGAWGTVEDIYGDIVDTAGTVVTYTEGGITLVSSVVEKAFIATFGNNTYALDTNEWRVKALSIQNHIDVDVPLSEGFMLGTHNSFNAMEHATATRYLDPNHYMSMYDQLDAGVRFIIMDVHKFSKADSFWAWEWDSELVLCHGQVDHSGCSAFDRTFLEGLVEVKTWLARNPGEVVHLKIDDKMDGEYDVAGAFIEETLGDYLYRPGGCSAVPADLSKRDVLDAGAQIFVSTRGACKNTIFQNSVFTDFESKQSFDQDNAVAGICPTDPTAGVSNAGEDRTVASEAFGVKDQDQRITADELRAFMKCGLNLTGLDMVGHADTDRITAAIWSWSSNEPNDWGTGEDCGESRADGYFNDIGCDKSRHFACENAAGDWYITNSSGTWSEGVATCDSETNGEYQFAVPVSSWENQKLIQAKEDVGVTTAFIHYSDLAEEGDWVANRSDSWNTDDSWTWSSNQPNNYGGNEDCATQTTSSRWNDANCNNSGYGYACEDDAGNWAVPSSTTGPWSEGHNACATLGGSYDFSVPTSRPANQALNSARAASGYSKVWLNLSDANLEGFWATYQKNIGNIAFRSVHNTYLVAEKNGNSDVKANRTKVAGYESFKVSLLSDGSCITDGASVSIDTQTGYYLRATSSGGLDSKASAIGGWEKFTLVNHSDSSDCLANGDVISLKSSHNKFVVAESNGKANANRSAIGSFEKFTVQF